MTDLIRLAERVEGLTGPDREVDGLIACAIFKTVKTDDDLVYLSPVCKSDECAPGTYWLVQRSGRSLQTAPSYTASLDAAMTLVPEGCLWTMDSWTRCDWSAGIWSVVPRTWLVNSDKRRLSATPALALAAASLRSFAAQRGQG